MGFATRLEQLGVTNEWQRLAGIGTFSWFRDTGDAIWSDELCRMLGRDPADGTPDRKTRWSHFPQSIRAQLLTATMRAIDEGSPFEFDAVLVRADGSTLGAIIRAEQMLDAAGNVLGVRGIIQDVTERKRDEERLVQLSTRLLSLQDSERKQIARDLHDQTAQNLALLSINLTLLERALPNADDKLKELIEQSAALVSQSAHEVRSLSYLLHPPLLDDAGLVPALNWYIEGFSERSGIEIDVDTSRAEHPIPAEVEETLYRVVQECLSNIHRHSDSGTASVIVRTDNTKVRLHVHDDGKGFPAELDGDGFDYYKYVGVGLRALQQRVQNSGGQLTIRSNKGGTQISVEIPIHSEEG